VEVDMQCNIASIFAACGIDEPRCHRILKQEPATMRLTLDPIALLMSLVSFCQHFIDVGMYLGQRRLSKNWGLM
jgi:hypothetical protein